MKIGSSIALLVLAAGCGKSSPSPEGGSLGSSAPQTAGSSVAGSTTIASPASGQSQASGKSIVPTLDDAVEYADGDTTRKLWPSKELVAEFNPSDAGKAAILAQDSSAKEVPQPQPVVRIWRLSGALRGEAFSTAVRTPSLIVSPVLHEGPSDAMPMRALPGGVLVTFKKDWDRARIDAWLALKSLAVKDEPVVADANMYLVKTAPGTAALLVAAELKKTGELVDVVPNFWRQNTTK
jgi:hypothetical protein